ncbi:hypothetical protein GG344DRAFT_70981 [Lentinula edodes]|nr:hypothetical protein GG344DRAFT_70981 [Lentinula edodes]
MSKLPLTSNHVLLLRYHLQHWRTSILKPSPREPTLPGVYLLGSLQPRDPFPSMTYSNPILMFYQIPYFYLTSLDLLETPSRVTTSLPQPLLAPFELQPAPSTLQHKPSYTKPYLKAYSDPGLTIIRRVQEQVERVRARKAARERPQKRRLLEWRQLERRRRRKRESGPIGHSSRRRRCPREGGCWPRRRQLGVKGGPLQPVDEDPDDGDDNDNKKEPCERCRVKKISCQMQAVRCLYSGRPSMVKQEGGSNPTGKRLAVLESQVAQLLADNGQLHNDHIKANTYHRHFNRKLDWLITDAARRRKSPPEMPEAGPLDPSAATNPI